MDMKYKKFIWISLKLKAKKFMKLIGIGKPKTDSILDLTLYSGCGKALISDWISEQAAKS